MWTRRRESIQGRRSMLICEAKLPNGKKAYMDATRKLDQFGRYINHSAKHPNLKVTVVLIKL